MFREAVQNLHEANMLVLFFLQILALCALHSATNSLIFLQIFQKMEQLFS